MSLPDPPEGCLHDVDNTIKYLEESTRVWKLYRNTLIPVSRLPPEILSIIFALLPSFGLLTVINFPLSNLLFALGPLTPIPHVCHRWREISLNLPYLWNHIDFTRLTSAGTAEILARSNMAPLHLEAQTMQWNNGKFLAFIKQLMTHIHHIRHLRVTVTPENLEEMFTQLVSSAPSLERLSIANDDIHQQEALVLPDNLFDGIAPKLIDLRLNNCGIRWESPLLKGLQNLKLISFPTRALTTLKPWLDALNQMPQLERLSLHGGIPIHSVTRLEAGLTVVLFSLTELDISAPARQCIAVFAHLVLPALTGLRVSVRTHHKNDTLSNYVRRLIPHVARNAHGPHDTEPLQSLFVGGDEEQSKVVAWTGPRQDTDVELRRLARVTFSTTTQYGLVEKDIPMHDVLLTALPINSITSLTVNGRTPLSREVWRTHAPRWDKLVVEFVASRVCVQAPLDATPRPGALSGTDPKANFWTLLQGLAPITVRSANPLCYLPSFVLLFCHVPFPYSYYTLDSSMPHPNGHASPLSLSRAAYYNSKRDSLWYLTIGLIITSTRHVAQ
jgi:hypothetical protein